MEEIKEAFNKVKQDIFILKEELEFLKEESSEINQKITKINDFITNLTPKQDKTHLENVPTEIRGSSTHHPHFKALKIQDLGISTGNGGVPTDRQTDRQTDKYTEIPRKTQKNSIDSAADILESLDNLKKEIRLKFKRLTTKEMVVFSLIYQLDEEKGHSDYKVLSERLNLTESSIRDYVGRLLKKGVPIEKIKINNKEIHLKISENLKKITNLNTILKLRDL